MQDKVNGLHSGTRFYDFYTKNQTRIEYHEHPKTHELIIVATWAVPNGKDDVDFEFEVTGIYPPTACELARTNAPYMINGKMPQILI